MILRAKSKSISISKAIEIIKKYWFKVGQLLVGFLSEKKCLSCATVGLSMLNMMSVKPSNSEVSFSLN